MPAAVASERSTEAGVGADKQGVKHQRPVKGESEAAAGAWEPDSVKACTRKAFQSAMCFRCGEVGHRGLDCESKAPACWLCGEPDHMRLQCPNKPCPQCSGDHMMIACAEWKCGSCKEAGHHESRCPNSVCAACGVRGHTITWCGNKPCPTCKKGQVLCECSPCVRCNKKRWRCTCRVCQKCLQFYGKCGCKGSDVAVAEEAEKAAVAEARKKKVKATGGSSGTNLGQPSTDGWEDVQHRGRRRQRAAEDSKQVADDKYWNLTLLATNEKMMCEPWEKTGPRCAVDIGPHTGRWTWVGRDFNVRRPADVVTFHAPGKSYAVSAVDGEPEWQAFLSDRTVRGTMAPQPDFSVRARLHEYLQQCWRRASDQCLGPWAELHFPKRSWWHTRTLMVDDPQSGVEFAKVELGKGYPQLLREWLAKAAEIKRGRSRSAHPRATGVPEGSAKPIASAEEERQFLPPRQAELSLKEIEPRRVGVTGGFGNEKPNWPRQPMVKATGSKRSLSKVLTQPGAVSSHRSTPDEQFGVPASVVEANDEELRIRRSAEEAVLKALAAQGGPTTVKRVTPVSSRGLALLRSTVRRRTDSAGGYSKGTTHMPALYDSDVDDDVAVACVSDSNVCGACVVRGLDLACMCRSSVDMLEKSKAAFRERRAFRGRVEVVFSACADAWDHGESITHDRFASLKRVPDVVLDDTAFRMVHLCECRLCHGAAKLWAGIWRCST